ncbi:MAG TPA: methionine adenosyltransferase [Armatimonadota bacterium]|nr:methionine adenosyltransferase [Armatimonadota bacterium]
MHIHLISGQAVNTNHRLVELVERKGIGHPDTICDRAAEELSVELSRYYREHFGAILHHNTDKVLLVGGRANATFGRGEVLDPVYLLLSGRATLTVDNQPVPVGEMATRHTAEWIQTTLPHLHLPGDMIIDYRIKESSPDLIGLFRESHVPLANDTSFAVAFAPLSELEQLVKAVEEQLNSQPMKQRFPMLGEDIKVMGLRAESRIFLTIAAAFIASATPDLDTYLHAKDEIAQVVGELAHTFTTKEVHVAINSADLLEEGIFYVTATGTSAEQGDDGQVGRGNRPTGLITPMRPMTLEAAAGKNPVSHVGKLYQVYGQLIVDRICDEIPEVAAASCALLSRIGTPINEPQAIAVYVESDRSEDVLQAPIEGIVQSVLDDWAAIRDGFLHRRWRLY